MASWQENHCQYLYHFVDSDISGSQEILLIPGIAVGGSHDPESCT